MNIDLLAFVLVMFIIIVVWKMYMDSDSFQLKCIISDVDNNKYCVRDREKLEEAADHLATVTKNLKLIVQDCEKNFPNQKNVQNLTKGFNPKKIVEILQTSEYTA